MTEITRAIAQYAATTSIDALDAAVRHEAGRAFLNFFGCAIGASDHETVDSMTLALAPFSGPAQAPVFGRSLKLDPLNAALVNGTSSHVFDFDDTLLSCAVHPTGPVAAAQLALTAHRPVSGADLLLAFVLGVEIEARIAEAIYDRHYEAGWHITGTVGVIGAAAACGRLLGLSPDRLTHALGIAATQASGIRAMFGSMCKPFHVGHAAQGGLVAALLAERGFTSSPQSLEGRRGFAEILGGGADLAAVPGRLGDGFALMQNSYKSYACGVVLHPIIDCCVALRDMVGPGAAEVDRIELRVNPMVLELTGNKEPRTGLEGKFSVYHAAAVALARGDGGEPEFADSAVCDPAVAALRERVRPVVDPAIGKDAARACITLRNGETREHHVPHASGSLDNPLSDDQLVQKFRRLAGPKLSAQRIDRLIAMCGRLDALPEATQLGETALGDH